jgi:hypothetical protein
MKNHILMIGAIIPGMIAFTSCSELPQQQISEAEAAVANAQTVGAQTYVPEIYFALEDSMKATMSLITEQEGKFLKNYEESIVKLEAVKNLAADVAVHAETKKQEIKMDISTMISEVQASIAESKQLIAEAPKGKGGAPALLAMTGELDALVISLTESNSLLESSQLQASLEKATVAKDKAVQINTELKEIMSKYKSAKS